MGYPTPPARGQLPFFLQLPFVPGFLPGVGSNPSQQGLSLFLLAAFFLGAVLVGMFQIPCFGRKMDGTKQIRQKFQPDPAAARTNRSMMARPSP